MVLTIENDDINQILFLMREGEIDMCNFLEAGPFSNTTYLANKSDSDIFFTSVILPSLEQPSALAMKIWLNWEELVKDGSIEKDDLPYSVDLEMISGLNYEKRMYDFITQNLIRTNLSNNFVPFVNFTECNLKNILNGIELTDQLSAENKEKLLEKFGKFRDLKNIKLNIMVTGTIGNKVNFPNLSNILSRETLPLYEYASILYQMLYTFKLMEDFKIQQGDLHLQNILVEVLPDEEIVTVNDQTFLTRYIPKIFDFDRGYCQTLGPNPSLESGSEYLNSVNRFRPSQDYYQFICGLISSSKSNNQANLDAIIPNILPDPTFIDNFYQSKLYVPGGGNSYKYQLNKAEFTLLNEFLSKNPTLIMPQFVFRENIKCFQTSLNQLNFLPIFKAANPAIKKIFQNGNQMFYFKLDPTYMELDLFEEDKEVYGNIYMDITHEQTQLLETYVKNNPEIKEGKQLWNGSIFINLPKQILEQLSLLKKLKSKAFRRMSRRIDKSELLYFDFNPRIRTLILQGGHYCQPVFDVSDQILYPLGSLFSNGFILNVTNHLKKPPASSVRVSPPKSTRVSPPKSTRVSPPKSTKVSSLKSTRSSSPK